MLCYVKSDAVAGFNFVDPWESKGIAKLDVSNKVYVKVKKY